MLRRLAEIFDCGIDELEERIAERIGRLAPIPVAFEGWERVQQIRWALGCDEAESILDRARQVAAG